MNTVPTIHFSQLPDDEQEKWRKFLVDNPTIRFHRINGTTEYEAEIEIWAPGGRRNNGGRDSRQKEGTDEDESDEDENGEEDVKKGVTPPSVHLNHLYASLLDVRERTKANLEPLPHYALFVALLSGSRLYQPRKKSRDFVLNKINELYQKYLTASRRRSSASASVINSKTHPPPPNSTNNLFSVFPIFVYDEFCKSFGLRSLSHTACWDFVFSVHALRKEIKVCYATTNGVD